MSGNINEPWNLIVVGLLVLFVVGVIVRVRKLMALSREIESKLDYSKMKKWEDDDDDWGEPQGSLVDRKRSSSDRFRDVGD